MNAFKTAPSAHPGNQSKAGSKCFISSRRSSLYWTASVSSPASPESRASFQETNNVAFLRPITLPLLHERNPDTEKACQNNFGTKQVVEINLKTEVHKQPVLYFHV